jgi:hypothetical protein
MNTISYHQTENGYVLDAPLVYYSRRYRKTITCPTGMRSDGASGPAVDIASVSWWAHDRLCETHTWDDGTRCDAWAAAWVLHDILVEEGRWFRARSWWLATGLWRSWVDMWASWRGEIV